jgi:hypothetical protein
MSATTKYEREDLQRLVHQRVELNDRITAIEEFLLGRNGCDERLLDYLAEIESRLRWLERSFAAAERKLPSPKNVQ